MRRAPAALGLEHVAPQVHLAEDAADRVRLFAPTHVGQRFDRIARGVEATLAPEAWHRVHADSGCERILVPSALGHERLAVWPDEVV